MIQTSARAWALGTSIMFVVLLAACGTGLDTPSFKNQSCTDTVAHPVAGKLGPFATFTQIPFSNSAAQQFALEQNTKIEAFAINAASGSNSISVSLSLFSNSSGKPSSQIPGSFCSFTTNTSGSNTAYTCSLSNNGVHLQSGTYWLMVDNNSSSYSLNWYKSPSGAAPWVSCTNTSTGCAWSTQTVSNIPPFGFTVYGTCD